MRSAGSGNDEPAATDQTQLGGVAINQLNVQHNFGNIGNWVRQARQGRGVATRAVRMISAFGFDRLKLTRLEIVAAVDNRASRRVAEKAGAQYECIARNRLVVKRRAIAAAVYSPVPSPQVDRKIAGEGN